MSESLLFKLQLLILNKSRVRAPNLPPIDRLIASLCAGLMRPDRLLHSAIVPDSDIQSLSKLRAGFPDIPYGVWSPEGDRFLTYRVDERMMYKLPFVVPLVPGERHQIPWVHFQNTTFQGDDRIQQAELMIFDMRDGSRVDLQIPKPIVIWEPTPKGGLRWSEDGRSVFAAPWNADGETLRLRGRRRHRQGAGTGHRYRGRRKSNPRSAFSM